MAALSGLPSTLSATKCSKRRYRAARTYKDTPSSAEPFETGTVSCTFSSMLNVGSTLALTFGALHNWFFCRSPALEIRHSMLGSIPPNTLDVNKCLRGARRQTLGTNPRRGCKSPRAAAVSVRRDSGPPYSDGTLNRSVAENPLKTTPARMQVRDWSK
jgi:hypothetical protein